MPTKRTKAQSREYHFGCSLARRMLAIGETQESIREAAERTQRDTTQRELFWHRAAGMLWVLNNDLDRWLPENRAGQPLPAHPLKRG